MENLISVDFSYNQLSGWVSSTRHFDHTGFLGNPGLYGLYLSPCQYDPPPPHHHHHHTCSSKVVLIVILLVPLITQHLEIKQLCTFINNKILFFFLPNFKATIKPNWSYLAAMDAYSKRFP